VAIYINFKKIEFMKKIQQFLLVFTITINLGFAKNNNTLFGKELIVSMQNIKEMKNGKCKIYYEVEEYIFYENTNLIDWKKTLKKIEKPIDPDPRKKYFVEKCKLVNGLKQGSFSISVCDVNSFETSQGTQYYISKNKVAVTGNYSNDEFDGTIKALNFIEIKGKSIRERVADYLTIEYENGKFKDQNIQYPIVITSANGFEFTPFVTFKDGKLSEILRFDFENNLPFYQKYEGSTSFVMRYTKKPYCSNHFSYLNKGKVMQNRIFNMLNDDDLNLEVYTSKLDDRNGTYLVNGNYKLFHTRSKLFDTTEINLTATFNFFDGKRNGVATIWYISKLRESVRYPLVQLTYKNDLLHGKCDMFFSNGKLAVTATFFEGLPIGEAISYANPDKYESYLLIEKVMNKKISYSEWKQADVHKTIDMIDEIVDIGGSDYKVFCNKIKKHGGEISDLIDYQIYSKINYKIDSIKLENAGWIKLSVPAENYSLFNNNKPMVTFQIKKTREESWFINIVEDIFYFDKNEKIVYSLKKQEKEKAANEEKVKKELQPYSIVKCSWCKNVEFEYKDGIICNVCRCVDSEGRSTRIDLVPALVCSGKCRHEAEEDCCQRNGYKFGR